MIYVKSNAKCWNKKCIDQRLGNSHFGGGGGELRLCDKKRGFTEFFLSQIMTRNQMTVIFKSKY